MDYTIKTIRSVPLPYAQPPPEQTSTVYVTDYGIEATTLARRPCYSSNLRRGREKFRTDATTGELVEYIPYQSRSDNISGLRASLNAVRRMIMANFHSQRLNELFITLTYGPGRGRSPPELAADFKAFWHRLHYHYPKTEYLVVYELCQDGHFHAHMLLKQTSNEPLYIPKERLDNLWGHGSTYVGRIRSVRATALYLSKMAGDKQRIAHIPAGFRVYRRSHGIIKPEARRMPRDELESFVHGNGYTLDHADRLAIEGFTNSGEEVRLNVITHEYFKRSN